MDGLDSLARPWVGSGEKKRQSPGRPGPDRQWSRPLSQPLHCHAPPQVLCAFHPVGSFGQEARSRLAPVNITSLPCCRCCSGSALRYDDCTPPRAVIPHSPFPIPQDSTTATQGAGNSHFRHEMQKTSRTSCRHFRRCAPTLTTTPPPPAPAPPQSPTAAPNSFFPPSAPRTP